MLQNTLSFPPLKREFTPQQIPPHAHSAPVRVLGPRRGAASDQPGLSATILRVFSHVLWPDPLSHVGLCPAQQPIPGHSRDSYLNPVSTRQPPQHHQILAFSPQSVFITHLLVILVSFQRLPAPQTRPDSLPGPVSLAPNPTHPTAPVPRRPSSSPRIPAPTTAPPHPLRPCSSFPSVPCTAPSPHSPVAPRPALDHPRRRRRHRPAARSAHRTDLPSASLPLPLPFHAIVLIIQVSRCLLRACARVTWGASTRPPRQNRQNTDFHVPDHPSRAITHRQTTVSALHPC